MLKKLASAHDSYVEISNNLREGTKVWAQHNTRLRGGGKQSDTGVAIRMSAF